MLLAGAVQVVDERLHAVEAGFVERFQDVERGEEERAGAAGRVEDGDRLDGVPEGAQQFRAFAVLDHVLGELADVEVEGDQVVDVADLAGGRASRGPPRSAAGGRRPRARSRWAGRYSAGAGLFQPLRRSMQVRAWRCPGPSAISGGSGYVHAVADGGVDVAVGVVA